VKTTEAWVPVMKGLIPPAVIASSALLIGGCSVPIVNDQPSSFRNDVNPVMTEHSLALECLGELIDQSGKPKLTVYVDTITDETVPPRFEQRRLSHGGSWWLHTAISKIGSDRVVSSTTVPPRTSPSNHIVLSGAWTQDDMAIGRADADLDGRATSGSSRLDFFLGGRRNRDVIAGDFLTVRNGEVQHATAISLAVDGDRRGVGLDIRDGSSRFSIDFSRAVNEGPQFAQRRITEAAALVHIARAFQVDYTGCAEMAWARPSGHQALLAGYLAKSESDRYRAVQEALVKAGYRPGPVDGVWGPGSASALLKFQSDRGLPKTGRPSAEVFALLQRPKSTVAHRL
jgi:hypothetical protein